MSLLQELDKLRAENDQLRAALMSSLVHANVSCLVTFQRGRQNHQLRASETTRGAWLQSFTRALA